MTRVQFVADIAGGKLNHLKKAYSRLLEQEGVQLSLLDLVICCTTIKRQRQSAIQASRQTLS